MKQNNNNDMANIPLEALKIIYSLVQCNPVNSAGL